MWERFRAENKRNTQHAGPVLVSSALSAPTHTHPSAPSPGNANVACSSRVGPAKQYLRGAAAAATAAAALILVAVAHVGGLHERSSRAEQEPTQLTRPRPLGVVVLLIVFDLLWELKIALNCIWATKTSGAPWNSYNKATF